MTILFSYGFNSPSIGTNFPIFFASGILPFAAYMDISQKTSQSLRFSRALLFYPGVTFVDAILARFFMAAITQVMIVVIVLSGIIIAFDLRVILDVPALALGFVMAFVLGLGVGTLNCYLISTYPFWERAWAILNRPLFVISCIFFVFDTISQPYRDFLWWNPLIHLVGQVRHGVYATYEASYVSPLYVFSVSSITFAAGLLLLRRHHREILNS